jgi:hypothetical protein
MSFDRYCQKIENLVKYPIKIIICLVFLSSLFIIFYYLYTTFPTAKEIQISLVTSKIGDWVNILPFVVPFLLAIGTYFLIKKLPQYISSRTINWLYTKKLNNMILSYALNPQSNLEIIHLEDSCTSYKILASQAKLPEKTYWQQTFYTYPLQLESNTTCSLFVSKDIKNFTTLKLQSDLSKGLAFIRKFSNTEFFYINNNKSK